LVDAAAVRASSASSPTTIRATHTPGRATAMNFVKSLATAARTTKNIAWIEVGYLTVVMLARMIALQIS